MLVETLKMCLQPKEGNPNNRPSSDELLKSIDKINVDANFMEEDKKTYEEFEDTLENHKFIKMFLKTKYARKRNFQKKLTEVF